MSGLTARHDGDTGTYVVGVDGIEIAQYHHRSDAPRRESPRPYLHPLRTRAGNLVTLDRPDDHVWHRGLSWALPNLGAHNFWGGPTFVRGRGYVQLPNNGTVRTTEVLEAMTGTAAVQHFRHRLAWTAQSGDHLVTEERRLGFHLVDDGWALTFSTAMTNVSGQEIAIGSPTTAGREDAGYGGLFWRGPHTSTGGTVLTPQGSGGDELRGRRAPWAGFTDGRSTVLVVDDVENPRHPPPWFARSEEYAGLCPAPFFTEELPFPDASTLRFRYAVVVADGTPDAHDLAARGRELLGLSGTR